MVIDALSDACSDLDELRFCVANTSCEEYQDGKAKRYVAFLDFICSDDNRTGIPRPHQATRVGFSPEEPGPGWGQRPKKCLNPYSLTLTRSHIRINDTKKW